MLLLICALVALLAVTVGLWASGSQTRPNTAEGIQRPFGPYQPHAQATAMTKWDLCKREQGWAQRRFTLPRN